MEQINKSTGLRQFNYNKEDNESQQIKSETQTNLITCLGQQHLPRVGDKRKYPFGPAETSSPLKKVRYMQVSEDKEKVSCTFGLSPLSSNSLIHSVKEKDVKKTESSQLQAANIEKLAIEAVSSGDTNAFQILLKKNANPFVRVSESEVGPTLLHLAAQNASYGCVLLLLKAGLKVDVLSADSQDKSLGSTPLHWAIEAGNYEMILFLIERGADIKLKNTDGHSSWFYLAYLVRDCYQNEDALSVEFKEKIEAIANLLRKNRIDPYEMDSNNEYWAADYLNFKEWDFIPNWMKGLVPEFFEKPFTVNSDSESVEMDGHNEFGLGYSEDSFEGDTIWLTEPAPEFFQETSLSDDSDDLS